MRALIAAEVDIALPLGESCTAMAAEGLPLRRGGEG